MKKIIFLTFVLLMSEMAYSNTIEIRQKNKDFDKKSVEINPGDKIVFHNDEKDITHNVYSISKKNSFELKTQAPGSKSEVTFKEEGETDVECAIHPNMKLKVKVAKGGSKK